MSVQEELIKQFREQQQKYAYYIIALCVAGIGFSVQQTLGTKLSLTQIPLAVAILSWCISIYLGLKFLNIQIAAIYKNHALIEISEGRSKISGDHPENIKIGIETITKILEKDSNNAMNSAKWQDIFFYIGVFAFISWRILEMAS